MEIQFSQVVLGNMGLWSGGASSFYRPGPGGDKTTIALNPGLFLSSIGSFSREVTQKVPH